MSQPEPQRPATACIAVVGSLNRDVTIPVDRLPGPGDTVVAAGPSTSSFGGKGANQAAAAAAFCQRSGAVAMIGRVGDDADGAATLADLRDRGVDVRGIGTAVGTPTGRATIAVDPHGENLIVVDSGANGQLSQTHLTAAVGSARIVLTQLEIALPTVQAAIRAATGTVILNPAPFVTGVHELVGQVDLIVPNRSELAYLVGQQPATDVDEVVRQVRALDTRAQVIVTMGGQGAVVVDADGCAEHIAAPPTQVVDTTGAGDCFCGVLAAMLADDAPLIEAAHIAVAAAALSVTAAGARGRLPRRDEVLATARRSTGG